jgi:hypothetical protein
MAALSRPMAAALTLLITALSLPRISSFGVFDGLRVTRIKDLKVIDLGKSIKINKKR